MARNRLGIWLIGARGGVATTTIVGLAALKKGLVDTAGLVSSLPQFEGIGLCDWADLVVGGHEIRDLPLIDEARRMAAETRVLGPDVIARCKPELERIDRRIRPGTIYKVGPTIAKL